MQHAACLPRLQSRPTSSSLQLPSSTWAAAVSSAQAPMKGASCPEPSVTSTTAGTAAAAAVGVATESQQTTPGAVSLCRGLPNTAAAPRFCCHCCCWSSCPAHLPTIQPELLPPTNAESCYNTNPHSAAGTAPHLPARRQRRGAPPPSPGLSACPCSAQPRPGAPPRWQPSARACAPSCAASAAQGSRSAPS